MQRLQHQTQIFAIPARACRLSTTDDIERLMFLPHTTRNANVRMLLSEALKEIICLRWVAVTVSVNALSYL